MLALGWMGGGAGLLGRATARLDPRIELVALAAYGWVWGFLYGAIMNLWFWPFARGGALDWDPRLGFVATLHRYWSFYVATSLGWDAAAAVTNALLILVTGLAVMRTLRRFAHRLDPVVEFA
jgi:energy-coupling factor transport system substrate-specific component